MSRLTKRVGPNDHVRGRADALIAIVEYGDYQCPHCARASVVVTDVLASSEESTKLVYRHFPLTQLHPQAVLAAQAAEAAAAQGRFWEMHDRLFRHRRELMLPNLVEHARALELDVARFEAELRTEEHLAKVADDFRSGVRSGVHGTPSFFVNGAPLAEPWSLDAILTALRDERFTLTRELPFTRG